MISDRKHPENVRYAIVSFSPISQSHHIVGNKSNADEPATKARYRLINK